MAMKGESIMEDIPKIIELNTKEDAIFFLNLMIILAIKRLDRYKLLIQDIDAIVEQHKDEKYIDISIGNRLLERMESLNLFLCNLFGDETKNAVSYVQFRKMLSKKIERGFKEFEIRQLDNETNKILLELKDRRNWVHHIPQTLFTSEIDYLKQNGVDEGAIRKKHTSETITVLIREYHAMDFIKEISNSCKMNYDDYRHVLQSMKKDYSALVGKSVRIKREYSSKPKGNEFIEIEENSFNRNKRKR